MQKKTVENCASVVLIFPKSNPRELFIQQKDPGLPNQFGADRALCPFGGNWFGVEAQTDLSPRDTTVRELTEELQLPANVNDPGAADRLKQVLATVTEIMVPHRLTLIEIDSAVWSLPEKIRPSFLTLQWYFMAALADEDWQTLVSLERQYGSLTNEGSSRVTSLNEVVAQQLRCAYAHDQALQQFWLAQGMEEAHDMFMYPNPPMIDLPWMDTYAEALTQYDVRRTPFI